MTRSAPRRLAACSVLALTAGLALARPALAETAAAGSAPLGAEPEVSEVVVTAPRGRAADVAPVKGSLDAAAPKSIITRKFIEESAPRVGDFTTSSVLAVSLASTPNSNGPGATDGAKLTLRGFQDGEYNITYDGIAWGDTNGPSHHANSFFPSSTIGGIVVDRSPGNATDLGQANFGGSLNLFSLPFEDRFSGRQTLTFGSFGTYQGVTTLATGPIEQLHGANFVFNMMAYRTDGYLTHSPSEGDNQFIKVTLPVTDKFRITALYTHNWDDYNQGDASANATVAQTEAYGKRFALSGDPTLQTYYGYNFTKKSTEFGYVRMNYDAAPGLSFENTTYEYWYSNKTLSGFNDGADATLGAAALAAANMVILTPGKSYPAGGSGYSSSSKVYGLPGYQKRNEYRVLGNVLRADKDFGFGVATAGVMYEVADTQRSRFDIDLITRQPDYREKAPIFPGPSGCGDLPVTVAPGKTWNGTCQVPLNINFDEYSGWKQYQPFAQFVWKPTDQLTVTPGVKYVHFELHVNAPILAIKGSQQPSYQKDTFTKTLPFFTANYKIRPDWSVYGQFAQGFLVPNISSFYVNNPQDNKVVPQESTNYQIGTVYNGHHLILDADLYYIDFKHKIQSITDLTTGETFETNSGGATYKGVEAQATYVLPAGFSVFGNYSVNSAVGKDDPNNSGYNGHQLAGAPFWTGASGVRFQHDGLISADDSWVTTLNAKFIGPQFATAASGAAAPTGKIHAFSQADLSTTYRYGNYSIQLQVLNLFDSQDITSFKGKALIAGTNLPATTSAQGGAANVFTYQVGRSYQLTLKAAF